MVDRQQSKLIDAYRQMAERIQEMLKEKQEQISPQILHALDKAKEKAVALEELTRDEAEEISAYLMRDLHDAATFLEEKGTDFKQWLRMETDLIEDSMLDLMPPLIDETRLALDELAERALELGEWRKGEIASPGVLECKHCQYHLHLTETAHIPACPQCQHKTFKRLTRD